MPSYDWPVPAASERKARFQWWSDGYHALSALSGAVRSSGLEPSLLELVKLRSSQLNGCAYCIDMHAKDARAAGESEQRLYGLSAWREAPFYTDRERAALSMTEAITLVAQDHVPESVIDEAAASFSPEELIRLVYAVIEINAWNRLAITVGAPEAGTYVPSAAPARPPA
jgi:AhpD family alkylhydroperoxidase